MRTLTKREEIIKAILFLPENRVESIFELIQSEIEDKSYDLTDDLIQGLRELGMVMRGEMDAIPIEDLLNEL